MRKEILILATLPLMLAASAPRFDLGEWTMTVKMTAMETDDPAIDRQIQSVVAAMKGQTKTLCVTPAIADDGIFFDIHNDGCTVTEQSYRDGKMRLASSCPKDPNVQKITVEGNYDRKSTQGVMVMEGTMDIGGTSRPVKATMDYSGAWVGQCK